MNMVREKHENSEQEEEAANKRVRMEPTDPGLAENKEESVNQLDVPAAEGKAEPVWKLNKAVGTKESLKMVEKNEDLHQKRTPETTEVLDKKVGNFEKVKEALQFDGASINGRNTPYYNKNATTPQQAYPLVKIILPGDWKYLVDIHDLVKQGTPLDPSTYPTFVCNRVHRLNQIQDEGEHKKLVGILSYITHLIKFKDLYSRVHHESAKGHMMPIPLQQRFKTLFTPTEEGTLPGGKIALLHSYVLVLSLHADNFKSDLTDIRNDLRMTSSAIKGDLLYLGGKIVGDERTKVKLATLPVPLKFQQKAIKRKRGA